VDPGRERLRDLSARLLRLHTLLLGRERQLYEAAHGPLTSGELLERLLTDRQFAWLRALSQIITLIDAAVDEDDPTEAANVAALYGQAQQLLRSGQGSAFEQKYHEALQESPEVVMAHAEVVKLFPRASSRAPSD
jgi:hypothetical protein